MSDKQPAKRQNAHQDEHVTKKAQRTSFDNKKVKGDDMGDESDDGFEYATDDENDYEEEIIHNADEDDEENDAAADGDAMGEGAPQQEKPRVWRHGIDDLASDEVLEYDPTTYKVYETATMEWPSLSFDIIQDTHYGSFYPSYPVKIFAVCGTQTDAADAANNKINVVCMENICETKLNDDDDDDGAIDLENNGNDDDDDAAAREPIITAQSIQHPGVVNRIRTMPQNQTIVSSWSDNGNIYVWDVAPQLSYLSKNLITPPPPNAAPLYTFNHGVEGYAMGWSPLQTHLATGDNNGNIYVHAVGNNGQTFTTSKPLSTGKANNSIEDIVWSPNEKPVFASVDTTGYLSVWHESKSQKPMISIPAHNAEINVLSWNKHTHYLLATGADNGEIKIWDLRYIKNPTQSVQASYSWHKKPITSIHWHPHESSMFVASSEDNAVSVWDLALEADVDEVAKEATGAQMVDYNIPGQLLFMHLGSKEVKEVQFHPQFPSLIVSTAANGMDVFKPANLDVVLPSVEPSEKIGID